MQLTGKDVVLLDDKWKKQGNNWGLRASTYVKNVGPKLEEMVGHQMAKYSAPMALNDHPELDESELLSQEDAS